MKTGELVAAGATLAFFAGFAVLYTWDPGDDTGEAITPGPRFSQEPTPFEDPWDLALAVKRDALAERIDLDLAAEVAEIAPLPEPLRIPFERGTAVPETERARLEAFADAIASQPDVALRVVGCADPPGPAALNERISQRRADSVAAALEEHGIAEERFATVVGRGEACANPERVVRVTPMRGAGSQPREG